MTNEPLDRFLDDLSAKTPVPAAGSAAAVVAAIAAALAEMAARFSGDGAAVARAASLRRGLLPLADEDARAVSALMAATGDERHEALGPATDVPRAIAEAAAQVRALADTLVERGNPKLRADALAAALLAEAAARTASELVAENLRAGGGRDGTR